MNFLDIIIIIILSYCIIRGIFRGILKELSSIIGVFGGFYAAYTYYMLLAGFLSKWIANEGHLKILSFLIIFCGIFILISILGIVIKYVLNIAFLGWADRIFGAGFGALKAVLIASVLLISLTAFLPKRASIIRNSFFAPHITRISEEMAKVVSKDMQHSFSAKITALKKAWKKKL